jgi:hypothetical protein
MLSTYQWNREHTIKNPRLKFTIRNSRARLAPLGFQTASCDLEEQKKKFATGTSSWLFFHSPPPECQERTSVEVVGICSRLEPVIWKFVEMGSDIGVGIDYDYHLLFSLPASKSY